MKETAEHTKSIHENENIEVRTGAKGVSIRFKGAHTLMLKNPQQADIEVVMVWLQSCYNDRGKKIITLRETAEFFGYRNRQDVDNRMQKWRQAGETILGVVSPWTERKWVLTPEVRSFIYKTWVENLHYDAQDIRKKLIESGLVEHEDSISLASIHNAVDQVDFNYAQKKLCRKLQKGHLQYSQDWLIQQLFELLGEQENLLVNAGVDVKALSSRKEEIKHSVSSQKPEHATEILSAKKLPFGISEDMIQNFLFNPSGEDTWESIARRCPDCHTDDTARKTSGEKVIHIGKQKTKQKIEKRYCKNSSCKRTVFTTSPEGMKMLLTFSFLLTILYTFFRSSFGRIATGYKISKSQLYKMVIIFGMSATITMHQLFKPRFSGIVCIDEKWVKVPKHFQKGDRKRKFLYFYVAVDPVSLDLLHSDIFETNDSVSTRAFLWGLRVKGYFPKAIITDELSSYPDAIADVFPCAVHHLCIFHFLQNTCDDLKKIFGKNYHQIECALQLKKEIHRIFACKDRRTCNKRYRAFMDKRQDYISRFPACSKIFSRLQNNFEHYANAIGSSCIPKTNNAAELVIKQFNYHYKNMAGFESLQTARIQIRLFALIYRFTPFTVDARKRFRNKCPLELAGYEVNNLPIYQFLRSPLLEKTKPGYSSFHENVQPLLKAA